VSKGGRTVLFVSHNKAAVQNLCRRGIVLSHGKLSFDGTSRDAIDYYLHSVSGEGSHGHVIDLADARRTNVHRPKLLEKMEFYTDRDTPVKGSLPMGAALKIRVHFTLSEPADNFEIGIGFDNMFGQRVFTAHSCFEPDRSHGRRVGPQIFVCNIPSFTLVPGEYTLRIFMDIGVDEVDLIDDAARLQVIESDYYGTGRVPWNGAFVLKHRWYVEEEPTVRSALRIETHELRK
jgi:lipopolysaccharide transport system ATP-binding protein